MDIVINWYHLCEMWGVIESLLLCLPMCLGYSRSQDSPMLACFHLIVLTVNHGCWKLIVACSLELLCQFLSSSECISSIVPAVLMDN